jgi:hypothetical protein
VPDAVQPVLIVAGLAGMVVGMPFGIALVRDASGLGRRVYRAGSEVGLTLLLVGMQTTVLTTLAAFGFFIVVAAGLAYVETSYLTINGRTYAFKREYGETRPRNIGVLRRQRCVWLSGRPFGRSGPPVRRCRTGITTTRTTAAR